MTFKKRNIPWNKGLTKEVDNRIKKYSDRMKGKDNPSKKYGAWNKNKKLKPLSNSQKNKNK